jgi:hypothetical protein
MLNGKRIALSEYGDKAMEDKEWKQLVQK